MSVFICFAILNFKDKKNPLTKQNRYNYVWINTNNASFDSGSFRKTIDGSEILICNQYKFYRIKDELTKK